MKRTREFIIRGAAICALLLLSFVNAGYDYKLTRNAGRINGVQEVETWYNLPMSGVIKKMRDHGYSDADYPYYIRDDGVKMLGDFVMVAADLDKYPRGTVVYTTLGQGLVCDTGEDLDGFDIAVNWKR